MTTEQMEMCAGSGGFKFNTSVTAEEGYKNVIRKLIKYLERESGHQRDPFIECMACRSTKNEGKRVIHYEGCVVVEARRLIGES